MESIDPGGIQICVHGFIGKLADGSIATYQTLPWDMVGAVGFSRPCRTRYTESIEWHRVPRSRANQNTIDSLNNLTASVVGIVTTWVWRV